MAISTNSPEKTTTEHQPPTQQPSKSDLPEPSSAPPPSIPATTVLAVNPNPSFNNSHPTPVPQIQPFLPPSQVSAVHPSFRPVAIAPGHQFSPVSFQNHVIQGQVQPPGVMAQAPSQQSTGANAMQAVQQMVQPPHYGQPGQQPMRMYAPLPNGYQMAVPQGAMNPPGILRYAPPYPQMLRPTYPQRPLGPVAVIPTLQRPPVMTMRGPVVPTIVRPPISLAVAQTEKPMTTIYVGKIASTVDNDFMLSLLQLCGPVKSWKRVPDPTTGALKGFGFCEFESVEGVLRALRLLSKLSIDGQQLMAAGRLQIQSLFNLLFENVVGIICAKTPEEVEKIFKVRYNGGHLWLSWINYALDYAPSCPELSKVEEEMKLNRQEILKVSPADFKYLPDPQKRYWVFAHLVIKRNLATFVAAKQLSAEEAAEDEEEEEESSKQEAAAEDSKVPKNDDDVGGSGPRGVAWTRRQQFDA